MVSDKPAKTRTITRHRIHRDLIQSFERTLEHQLRIVLDRFDRTDRLIRLNVVILSGMIVITGFLFTQGLAMGYVGAAGISTSIILVLLGAHRLVRLNTALHREQILELGPDPFLLIQKIETQDMDDNEFLDYKAHTLPKQLKANQGAIASISQRQEQSMTLIITAIIVYTTAIAYIVGVHIYG